MPMEKRHMEQNYPQYSKERGSGISEGRATAAQWSKFVMERVIREVM
jgi:hypothetical protein